MTTHEINQLDTYLGGNKISIAGGFSDFEFPDAWITSELDAAWNNGYWPLINIGAGTMDDTAICPNDPNGDDDYSDEIKCTAAKIASGDLDPAISNWAQEFKAWSDNGNKTAYLAPLQEMNGEWIDYFGYGDPTKQNYYKQAFIRIQDIFINQVGVDPDSVIWIFAPNGYSESTSDNFENYYPGDSAVDIIGFSSFNWCDCWNYTDPEWYEDIYEPYLVRMTTMAPGKPIFIVEIASETYDDGTHTPDYNRADWFTDTLTKIGNYPGVEGVIYFNRSENPYYTSDNCNPPDYSLDANGAEGKSEFRDVVTQPPYGYKPLPSGKKAVADFDGDGDTDVSVYRPSNGRWYIQGQGNFKWGYAGDLPVPGDYDGDGTTDIAIFRPSNGKWYVMGSAPASWGATGDIPLQADYTGDGAADKAVLRTSTKRWYIQGIGNTKWYYPGDIPVPCDYDGDGSAEVAIFRPSNNKWYVMGESPVGWGQSGDIPVPADYDGDGACEIAVFRPSNGVWYVMGIGSTAWGLPDDIPVPGDYDGDGATEYAVLRPSNGKWYIKDVITISWYASGDFPLPVRDTNADGDPYQ
jgi:hypothetical protein